MGLLQQHLGCLEGHSLWLFLLDRSCSCCQVMGQVHILEKINLFTQIDFFLTIIELEFLLKGKTPIYFIQGNSLNLVLLLPRSTSVEFFFHIGEPRKENSSRLATYKLVFRIIIPVKFSLC